MSWHLEHLRFCAFCPNPCRSAVDDGARSYRESQTPSAMSLIAVLAAENKLRWSADIAAALADDAVARRCAERCPYDFDIPTELAAFLDAQPAEEA